MRPISEQVILITGATEGMGRQLARDLAAGVADAIVNNAGIGGTPGDRKRGPSREGYELHLAVQLSEQLTGLSAPSHAPRHSVRG